MAQYLSGNMSQDWNTLSLSLPKLTQQMSALYHIYCYNWMPTTNPCTWKPERAPSIYKMGHMLKFDFCELVFRKVLSLATWKDSKFLLLFPVLIFKVLESQHPLPIMPNVTYVPPERYNEDSRVGSKIAQVKIEQKNGRKGSKGTKKTVSSSVPPIPAKDKVSKIFKERTESVFPSAPTPNFDTGENVTYDEFVLRIPKVGSSADVCQALRGAFQTLCYHRSALLATGLISANSRLVFTLVLLPSRGRTWWYNC